MMAFIVKALTRDDQAAIARSIDRVKRVVRLAIECLINLALAFRMGIRAFIGYANT